MVADLNFTEKHERSFSIFHKICSYAEFFKSLGTLLKRKKFLANFFST